MLMNSSSQNKKEPPWETVLGFNLISGIGTLVIGFFAWWAYCYGAKAAGLPEVSFMESMGITMFLRHIALPLLGNFKLFGK